MIRRALLVLALLSWTPALAAPEVDFGRYHALVIGINDYQHLPKLRTAVNDATAVANVLRKRYGFEVTLLLNPTRSDVIRGLDVLRGELTELDNLIIYYAGHGVLDVEADMGFWQPVDAEEGTRTNWIAISGVTGTVKAMAAKHVMVVSDSCYSGRLTRGGTLSVKSGEERVAELQRLARKRSRTALVAGGLEPVWDGGADDHSVFARAFLTTLRENREVLDRHRLFSEIRRPIVVNSDQTPEYADIRLADHDGGDFLFVPIGLSEAAATSAVPEVTDRGAREPNLEVVFWESIADATDPAAYEAYLQQFPEGTFAALARRKLELLGESEPQGDGAGGQPSTAELALWLSIKDSDNPDDYELYLNAFPGGSFEARVRQRLQEIAEGGGAQASTGGRFDGEWTGRAVLSRGTSRYCAKTKLRLTILGNRIEGESWRGADVEGTIDATGHLEAKTYPLRHRFRRRKSHVRG